MFMSKSEVKVESVYFMSTLGQLEADRCMNMSADLKTAGSSKNMLYSATEQIPVVEYLTAIKTDTVTDDSRTNIHSLWDPTGSHCRDSRNPAGPSASGSSDMIIMGEITYRLSGSFYTAA